jgi:ATP-binding cassette subfamily F protein uup
LEEFLMQFNGCLLLVSHDRYFMDRLVEHIFVFEGEGKIKDFPGNYTEYREQLAANCNQLSVKNVEKLEPSPKKQPSTQNVQSTTSQKKLSFKEKQEFENIEKELPLLETRKAQLTNQLSAGGSHQDLSSWAMEIEKLSHEIDEKTLRWLELSESD